jgi:hypothetical protein
MAGKKFLNPVLKSVLCCLGILILGYFLYPSLVAGKIEDGTTALRLVVFLGFLYLLAQSLREMVTRPRD